MQNAFDGVIIVRLKRRRQGVCFFSLNFAVFGGLV
nr:MAG TPA: hypothetical protein [Caudoviricetes sp.]